MNQLTKLAAIALAVTVPLGTVALGSDTAVAASTYPAHYSAPYLELSNDTKADLQENLAATGTKNATLAFLIPKSGCTAQWEASGAPVDHDTGYGKTIDKYRTAGGNVIISFGGAAGGELAQTCTSVTALEKAYEHVVDTYGVTRLDFDVEMSVLDDTAANSRRDRALAKLQAARPDVTIDFTVPVSEHGLLDNAVNMLTDAKNNGVKVNLVNIMTMDFGTGNPVLSDAKSGAIATEKQLAQLYPSKTTAQVWHTIGLTPIAGVNDDNDGTFSQADAKSLVSFAKSKGVQELAFWELHSYDKATGYAYSRIFRGIDD